MPTAANDTEIPTVREDEVLAYVAGSLSPERRRAVEGFLACNPDLAARVMTGLHMRGLPEGAQRRSIRGVRPLIAALAACVISATAGWAVASGRDTDGWREIDGDLPPEYVEDAAEALQATRVRTIMVSQVDSPTFDPAEIRATLGLSLPRLPAGWTVTDVQVYPTDEGPGVHLTVQTTAGVRLHLLAVRADTLEAGGAPELAKRGREVVAYWEKASSAFVLSGGGSRTDLLRSAMELSGAKSL